MIRILSLILALLLLCLGYGHAQEPTEAQPQLETSPLVVIAGETRHGFTVELADEFEDIRAGLMFRTELADDAGMLFDLGTPRRAAFWMKNTILPLDMLFLDTDGEVLAIAKNTVPGSLRRVDPGVPVRAVLEVNAGLSDSLGLSAGDRVEHEVFVDGDG